MEWTKWIDRLGRELKTRPAKPKTPGGPYPPKQQTYLIRWERSHHQVAPSNMLVDWLSRICWLPVPARHIVATFCTRFAERRNCTG